MSSKNPMFLDVNDVSEIMRVSESKAYSVIKQLNKELKSKGYITVCGKISKKFFEEKIYI